MSIQPSDTSFVLAWLERVVGLQAFGAFVVYSTKGRYTKVFANFTDPIKITVSILLGLIIGVFATFLTYEGISLPFVGQVIDGRVANAVDAATSSMVTTFERDALQAQLDKERRDRATAEAASAKAQERADATEAARQVAEGRIAELQEEAHKAGLDKWSEEELKWLGRH